MRVTVTIPAYNEEGSLGHVIDDIRRVMDKTGHKYDIMVVDDGSTDKTAQVAKKKGAKVLSHPYNYGLAEAFRTEIAQVLKGKSDVIVHTDADGQYRAEDIPKLLAPIKKKEADLVLGSRFLGRIESMPIVKRLGNKAFSKVISKITRVKITDGQTGFRAFTREFAQKVQIRSSHTYTQEMIIRCVMEKFRVVEVPIYFGKRTHGESRLMSNPFGFAAKAWINILRIYRDYEPLKFFGVIGTVLFLGSVAIGAYFLYLQQVFGIGIGTRHTGLLFMLIMLLFSGIQIILFGFLADKGR